MTIEVVRTDMPLLSLQAWKLWDGDVIFERWRGGTYYRMASIYDLSPKDHLIPYQPKFADAVHAWQALPESIKNQYRRQANQSGKNLPGYQYFLSLYLRDRL